MREGEDFLFGGWQTGLQHAIGHAGQRAIARAAPVIGESGVPMTGEKRCPIIVHFHAAAFTAVPATKCGMEFFPIDKIVFASDCPFDPEGGTMFPRETLRILDNLKMDKVTSDKVFWKNLEAVTGKKIVK